MREMFELIENLSERYKLGNHETKYDILQKTEFELFVRPIVKMSLFQK